MAFRSLKNRTTFSTQEAHAVYLIRRRLNLNELEFSIRVGFPVEPIERSGNRASAQRLIALLRHARTEEERGLLLAALASRGIRASDLAPELLGGLAPEHSSVHA